MLFAFSTSAVSAMSSTYGVGGVVRAGCGGRFTRLNGDAGSTSTLSAQVRSSFDSIRATRPRLPPDSATAPAKMSGSASMAASATYAPRDTPMTSVRVGALLCSVTIRRSVRKLST